MARPSQDHRSQRITRSSQHRLLCDKREGGCPHGSSSQLIPLSPFYTRPSREILEALNSDYLALLWRRFHGPRLQSAGSRLPIAAMRWEIRQRCSKIERTDALLCASEGEVFVNDLDPAALLAASRARGLKIGDQDLMRAELNVRRRLSVASLSFSLLAPPTYAPTHHAISALDCSRKGPST